MPSYTINSTSIVDGSAQNVTQAASVQTVEEKSSQEDFLTNVVAIFQSQKFNDIKVPEGEASERDYLFYDPAEGATQPTVEDWKEFIQGSAVISEDHQIKFDTIVSETFSLGKKFILALKSSIATSANKNIFFTSRFNYSMEIIVGV